MNLHKLEDKIIISGASGNLGGLTIQALLDRGVPTSFRDLLAASFR